MTEYVVGFYDLFIYLLFIIKLIITLFIASKQNLSWTNSVMVTVQTEWFWWWSFENKHSKKPEKKLQLRQ